MSITDFSRKIKSKFNIDTSTILLLFIVIGIGIGSFGLGILYERDNNDALIKSNSNIENFSNSKDDILIIDENNSSNKINMNREGMYVASKNGKMYYRLDCSGAGRIKEENKVWFATSKDAEDSGYQYASSCK